MQARTWNVWDVRALNGVMRPPECAAVRVGFFSLMNGGFTGEMRWNHVMRFGDRHPERDTFDVDLWFDDRVFRFEFAAEDERFVLRVTPLERAPDVCFVVHGLFPWRAEGEVELRPGELELRYPEGMHVVDALGKPCTPSLPESVPPGLAFAATHPLYMRCNHAMDEAAMNGFLASKQSADRADRVRGIGALEGVPEAAFKAVGWNSVYDTIAGNVCTPVSRDWCALSETEAGSYVLYEWDTFFNGVIASLDSPQLAATQVDTILAYQYPDGMVPNIGSHADTGHDGSQPPVGAHCVLKLYRRLGDRALLERTFEPLLAWNRWWRVRAHGRDGLLELGAAAHPGETPDTHYANWLQNARYESGLDDSPMYDDAVFDPDTMTMTLADAGMNGLYVGDCRALATIARILGRNAEARELDERGARYAALVQRHLWEDAAGIFANRGRDGAFTTHYAPTSFYPLFDDATPADRVRRLVDGHLLNDAEFWGPYPLPSIARSDPAFPDNHYWRGRIWPPVCFLVYEALQCVGERAPASALAAKCLELFLPEWRGKNHIHENYNADTAEGCDNPKSSNNFYSWGGLLPFLAAAELADARPDGSVHFGAVTPERTGIANVPWNGGRLSVLVNGDAPGLRITLDEQLLLSSGAPCAVRLARRDDGEVVHEVHGTGHDTVRVWGDLARLFPHN